MNSVSNPLSARLAFRLRTLTNCGVVLVAFIPAAATLALLPYTWLTTLLLIGALAYLFFFVLQRRVIKIKCPGCGKRISTNTPWVCGFCKEKNTGVDDFPFVHQCEHCNAEPKAYKCHHRNNENQPCGKLIFFTEDELQENYASCLNSLVEAPKPDERTERLKGYQGAKEEKLHDVEMAELDEKLKKIKERSEGPKIKTPQQQVEETFEKHYAGIMGPREYARKKRTEAMEQYKDDPEALKEALDAIEEILKRIA